MDHIFFNNCVFYVYSFKQLLAMVNFILMNNGMEWLNKCCAGFRGKQCNISSLMLSILGKISNLVIMRFVIYIVKFINIKAKNIIRYTNACTNMRYKIWNSLILGPKLKSHFYWKFYIFGKSSNSWDKKHLITMHFINKYTRKQSIKNGHLN